MAENDRQEAIFWDSCRWTMTNDSNGHCVRGLSEENPEGSNKLRSLGISVDQSPNKQLDMETTRGSKEEAGDNKEVVPVAVGGGKKRNKRTLATINRKKKKANGNKDKKETKDLQLSHHAKNLVSEQQRRNKMKTMYQELQALLPCVLSPKENLSTIIDEAINYIKTLQRTLQKLETQKIERLHAGSSTVQLDTVSHPQLGPFSFPRCSPPVFRTWTSPNVSLNVCGIDVLISICSLKKPQLFTSICFVLEKYKFSIISAQISSDQHKSMYFIHARVNDHDEFLADFRYEAVIKQAALEIMHLVNSESS